MDEFSFFNAAWEDIDEIVGQPPRRHRRPALALATTRGAGRRRATRRCAGTSRTPTAAACATRWSCTGRTASPTRGDPPPVLPRGRHHADDRSTITGAADARRSTTACAQIPVHGASIDADVRRRRTRRAPRQIQYFEQMGHRGLWADGWKATTYHEQGQPHRRRRVGAVPPRRRLLGVPRPGGRAPRQAARADRGRGGSRPASTACCRSTTARIELFAAPPRPGTVHARQDYVYYPPIAHVPADACPPFGGRDVDGDRRGRRRPRAASRACSTRAAATTSATRSS